MKDILLKQYQFSHDFCMYLHDLLVTVIEEGEKNNVFDVSLQFKDIQEANKFYDLNLEGEELWKWLEKNNHNDILEELAIKKVFAAVLADFCEFLYESLSSSSDGKLTVAFSLLRKPFKENLYFLEWLLADMKDFSHKFHNYLIHELSVSNIKKETRIKVIRNAMESCENSVWIEPEFIYDLRYSKSSLYGYESVWNKATHLITTFKDYPTEKENLNFIFANTKELIDDLWQTYYRSLPILLIHTIEIVFAFIRKYYQLDVVSDDIIKARRSVGFVLWSKDFFNSDDAEPLLKNAREILKTFSLKCPVCKTKMSLAKKNLYQFYYSGGLFCKHCNTYVELSFPSV